MDIQNVPRRPLPPLPLVADSQVLPHLALPIGLLSIPLPLLDPPLRD